jgi:hypothetical protein
MNGLMKRILVLVVVLVPAAASADKAFMTGKGTTWDCKKDPVVSIMHGKGTYKLKGACTTVNVSGGSNKLTIESVDELNLTGAKNTVTVTTVGTINLTGSKNNVTWKAAKTGDAPSINNVGKDNTVAQTGAPATATPPAATATAPKTSGGGTAIDCAKNPSFVYADNDGTFTLSGTCKHVMISGNNNKLTIENAEHVMLSGNKNSVTGTLAAVDTSGNDNSVSYKGAKPKISNTGNGNKIGAAK